MKESSSSAKSIAIGVAVLVIAELILRWGLSSSSIDVLKWLRSVAIARYSIPGWLVGLIAAGPLPLGYAAMKIGRSTGMIAFHHEDQLYGIKWRWMLRDGMIYRLACFCPTCDNQIIDVSLNIRIHNHPQSYTFSCDYCKTKVGIVETVDNEEPLDLVKREIQRRYRTGEFKQRLNEP